MDFTKALQTEWSGWLVAVMTGVQIALPYLLRRVCAVKLPSGASSPGDSRGANPEAEEPRSLGITMRWHYLLGFALPAAALWHGWIPMASGHMPRTSMTGLWLATFALGLLFLQLLIGLAVQRLCDGDGLARRSLRRIHFAAMLAIAALALSHMLLN